MVITTPLSMASTASSVNSLRPINNVFSFMEDSVSRSIELPAQVEADEPPDGTRLPQHRLPGGRAQVVREDEREDVSAHLPFDPERDEGVGVPEPATALVAGEPREVLAGDVRGAVNADAQPDSEHERGIAVVQHRAGLLDRGVEVRVPDPARDEIGRPARPQLARDHEGDRGRVVLREVVEAL